MADETDTPNGDGPESGQNANGENAAVSTNASDGVSRTGQSDHTAGPEPSDPAPATDGSPAEPKKATDAQDPKPDAASERHRQLEHLSREAVDLLLRDATLVEKYAGGSGLLKNANFLSALQAARNESRSGGLDVSDDAYSELRTELNKVLRTIYPITLADLRDQARAEEKPTGGFWEWFKFRMRWFGKVVSNGTIAMLAIIIFLMTASYTLWAQRAELIIAETRKLESQDRIDMERKYLTWLIDRLVQNRTEQDVRMGTFWVEGAIYLDSILAFEQEVNALNGQVDRAISAYPMEKRFRRLGNFVCFETHEVAGMAPNGSALPPELAVRWQWMRVICPDTPVKQALAPLGSLQSSIGTRQSDGDAPDTGPQDSGLSLEEGLRGLTGAFDNDGEGGDEIGSAGAPKDAPRPQLQVDLAGRPIPPNNYIAPTRGGDAGQDDSEDPKDCETRVRDLLAQISTIMTEPSSSNGMPEVEFDLLRDELFEAVRCARAPQNFNPYNSGLQSLRGFKVDNAGELERKYRVASKWWLPSLYGALGAVVYTLGFMLSRLQPDPKFFRSLVRIMMGSLAGVTVVNFFTPELANLLYVPMKSMGLLALAFLAGFSVEVVLELLRGVVNRWSERAAGVGGNGSHDA